MRNTNLPSFAVFCVHLIKLLHLCLILLHDLCTLLDWFSFILYIGLGSFGLQSFWISFAKLWIMALKEKKNLQWMFESRFKIYILLQFLWNLLLPLGNKKKNPPTYLGWVESFFKPFLIFAASFFPLLLLIWHACFIPLGTEGWHSLCLEFCPLGAQQSWSCGRPTTSWLQWGVCRGRSCAWAGSSCVLGVEDPRVHSECVAQLERAGLPLGMREAEEIGCAYTMQCKGSFS